MKREAVNQIIAEAREAYILGAKQPPDDEGLAYAIRTAISRVEQIASRRFDPYSSILDELQSRRASIVHTIGCLEAVRR